jgi:hypothetical protein
LGRIAAALSRQSVPVVAYPYMVAMPKRSN